VSYRFNNVAIPVTVLPRADAVVPSDSAAGGSGQTLLQNFPQKVATLAALKALVIATAANQLSVFVQGGAAAGDGLGGWFRYESASAVADDGANYIAPNVGAGRWIRQTDKTIALGVASIAALKALPVALIPNGASVSVAGYYSANDGGGGLFVYASASAVADNGGTVIAPTAGGGRWLRAFTAELWAEWFGAKGDGATDDDAAIASLMATDNILRFGNRVFAKTAVITMNEPGTILAGSGKQYAGYLAGTRLKKLAGAAVNVHQQGDFTTLRDLTLDNNALGGDTLSRTGHYLKTENLWCVEQGPGGYSLHDNSVNLSGLCDAWLITAKIEDTLYSHYRHVQIAGQIAGNALEIVNAERLKFDHLTIENSTDTETLYIHGVCAGLSFDGFFFEDGVAIAGHLFLLSGATVKNVEFRNFSITQNFAAGASRIWYIIAANDVNIARGNIRDTSAAGRVMIEINGASSGVAIRDVSIKADNAFVFINCSGALPSNITIENILTEVGGAAGAMVLNGSKIVVRNTNLNLSFGSATDVILENCTGTIDLTNTQNVTIIGTHGTITNAPADGSAGFCGRGVSAGGATVIASAAGLELTPYGEIFEVSGVANITSIGSGNSFAGRRVTLIFQDALVVTEGANLKLAGNFVTTADDTIELVCGTDGVTWFEVARSVN